MTKKIREKHSHIDVVVNNAGVFKTTSAETPSGIDVRLVVNTIAPFLLTKLLLPVMDTSSRVINLSSAAQSPIDLKGVQGATSHFNDSTAYAQSKLGITMWTNALAKNSSGPIMVSVNPASLLGSKMVKEAYGMDGKDLGIGADILVRAALSNEFDRSANGKYFNNDRGVFDRPHPDGMDAIKCQRLVDTMEEVLERLGIDY